MKAGVLLLVSTSMLLAAPTALGQSTGDAGTDVDAAQAEVDRDYAQTLASDCRLACRALSSMKRATERLCALDPGPRCARARQELGDATTHVHAACPDCGEETGEEFRPAPQPAAARRSETIAMTASEVPRRGGCAGCTTARARGDAVAPLALMGLAILAMRRRRS